MNDQLQNALSALIMKANSGIDASTKFLSAEIPDVVRQLIVWNIARETVWLVFGIVMLITATLVVRKMIRDYKTSSKTLERSWVHDGSSYKPATESCFLTSVACGLALIIGLIISASCVFKLLQLWLAPKVWLIEYAASLTK